MVLGGQTSTPPRRRRSTTCSPPALGETQCCSSGAGCRSRAAEAPAEVAAFPTLAPRATPRHSAAGQGRAPPARAVRPVLLPRRLHPVGLGARGAAAQAPRGHPPGRAAEVGAAGRIPPPGQLATQVRTSSEAQGLGLPDEPPGAERAASVSTECLCPARQAAGPIPHPTGRPRDRSL